MIRCAGAAQPRCLCQSLRTPNDLRLALSDGEHRRPLVRVPTIYRCVKSGCTGVTKSRFVTASVEQAWVRRLI